MKNRVLLYVALVLTVACAIAASAQEVTLDYPITRLAPIEEYKTGFDPGVNIAEIWELAPEADYHNAVVRIQCPNGFAGSGVMVRVEPANGIVALTNEHVVEGATDVSIVGRRGTVKGRVVYRDPRNDLAVVWAEGCNAGATVPIAESLPGMGSKIELCGYGGPNPRQMIARLGKRIHAGYELSIDAACISGDSGGPMLVGGQLVGINWGGPGRSTRRFAGWGLVHPATSHATPGLLQRVLTQVCGPLGCRPVIGREKEIPLCPPQNSPPPASGSSSVAPSQPSQPGALPCPCPPGKQGEPGPAGPQGPAGPKGDPGEVTADQISAIIQAVSDNLRNDPNMRGPEGPQGPAGPSVSDAQLAAAIEAYFQTHPNTISLSLVDGEGRVLDRDTVPLGGELKLQFVEKK